MLIQAEGLEHTRVFKRIQSDEKAWFIPSPTLSLIYVSIDLIQVVTSISLSILIYIFYVFHLVSVLKYFLCFIFLHFTFTVFYYILIILMYSKKITD